MNDGGSHRGVQGMVNQREEKRPVGVENGSSPGYERREGPDPPMSKRRYRGFMLYAVMSAAVVSVVPLVIMTWINYHQYEEAFHQEAIRPIARFASNAKRSLELFLQERLSALSLVVREKEMEELENQEDLERLLRNMKESFGGFIDLGVIDAEGRQVAYAGPYRLEGKNYRDQDWFNEVGIRGVYVSDVFLGYRKLPHFVIAVKHETEEHESYFLRATIDTETINKQVLGTELQGLFDAFIVNREGVLQTPSRNYGAVLDKMRIEVPPYSGNAEVLEMEDDRGEPLAIGYGYVEGSPFVVMMLSRSGSRQESWLTLRRELVAFLSVSVILILAMIVWGSVYMTNKIREADIKRAEVFHKMEYTNRMAVIGRLAAGVAHEINNPLAIISEKAGLLGDLLTLSHEPPKKEKMLGLVDSVVKSVDRCGAITHRLLGFAKHMDVERDKIGLEPLLREVLGFLEKEAHYRGIQVSFDVEESLPVIESDRSQLQQVFLNLINNAFAAMEDGGRLEISIRRNSDDMVAVSIADNGIGIPKENLEQIFEPFFTTKKGYGTGLGLSITYGIVEKLGGRISVESEVGKGTSFTVYLPVR